METRIAAADRPAVDAATIAEAFLSMAASRPSEVAIRTKGDEFTLTWGQWRDRAGAVAGGLARLGLGHGDTLAIMLINRPEFHIVDVAAVLLGAAPFSIYQTYPPEEIRYVVSDAGSRIVVVESQFLDVVLEARQGLPQLEHVIVIDPPDDRPLPAGVTPLAEVEALDPDFDVAASAARVRPEDILTLIYTSGTTGPPKGVQLTHRNLLAAMRGIESRIGFPDQARVVSWLPAAHIAERGAHHYLPIVFGLQITSCPNPRDIFSYLPEVRPHWFFAVPRVWEKLKAGLETMVAGLPDDQRERIEQAIAAGREKVRLEQRGEPVPVELADEVARADEDLFSGLRAQLGLDEVLAVNCGAAPTPVEVLEFFHAIGLPVAELWGMSETCGAGCVNPSERIKLGTVGPPSPSVQIRLAEDGEVLVRGEVVMSGYRNAPDQTAETIDAEGWLRTGDIGEIDEDGYLRIVDRKKEIIINAAGKNMSPANIEATLKSASPLIGQAVAIGDGRPYNTALIVLDSDFAPLWASQQGLEGKSLEDLADESAAVEAVQEAIDGANAKLARVEQIKKFTVVRGDWLPGGDELTPTMKLKRRPIDQKYAEQIEAMYS